MLPIDPPPLVRSHACFLTYVPGAACYFEPVDRVRMSLPIDIHLSEPRLYRISLKVCSCSSPDQKCQSESESVECPTGSAVISIPVSALAVSEAILSGISHLPNDFEEEDDLLEDEEEPPSPHQSGSLSE